ncbi:hypothetical protein SELMODRAFT_123026, partial [Selaginella moellendorffii]
VDTERLQQLVRLVGRKRLVLDLSCRKKMDSLLVAQSHWIILAKTYPLIPNVVHLVFTFYPMFLVHGVDVEGKQLGIDEELVKILGQWSPIPVTYAGGVTLLEDLDLIKNAGGVVDVTLGSALDIFGGNVSYSDVLSWHRDQS